MIRSKLLRRDGLNSGAKMKKFILLSVLAISLLCSCSQRSKKSEPVAFAGNPVIEGWYADPEGIVFGDEYWIYPTFSDDYGQPDTSTVFSDWQLEVQKNTINPQYLKQTFFNAFSSKDLVTWEKHSHVLDIKNVKWASYSVWAPSIIKANNK